MMVIIKTPLDFIGKGVHVAGWNRGAVFILESIENSGAKILRTPRTGKRYKTFNNLTYTKKNLPKEQQL